MRLLCTITLLVLLQACSSAPSKGAMTNRVATSTACDESYALLFLGSIAAAFKLHPADSAALAKNCKQDEPKPAK